MKIARLGTLLGITLVTLAALIAPAKAHADDTYCSNSPTGLNTCCVWSGPRLVMCYTF